MIEGEVLVVGLGSIGERHVRNLLRLGQQEISVLRRSQAPPRTLKGDEYRTLTEIDLAFERQPVAVIIATPTALHSPFLQRAIEIGASVLVEVPLAHSLQGLETIEKRARETGSAILMGHNLRFHPGLRAIRESVLRGDIGEPLFSRARFGEYLPDCHPWEDYRGRYEARSDLGGGVVLTSIHEIDNAFWLFGPVKGVTSVVRSRALDVNVEDVAMMVLEHESGVRSEVTLDFVQRIYRRNLEIVGSEGTIEWEWLGDRVKIFTSNDNSWTDLVVLDDYDINDTYMDELRHLARVTESLEKPLIDLTAGLHVLGVGLAALRSSVEECRIDVTQ